MSTVCFHCHQDVPDSSHFRAKVLGQVQPMCCPGCQAVTEAIVANGLEDYYRFRTEPAIKADGTMDSALESLDIFDQSELQEEFVVEQQGESIIQLTLEGISCAACGWLIEKQLTQVEGIKQVAINVAARRGTISWYSDKLKLSQILSTIEKIGYHALPFQPDNHEASYVAENKRFLKRLGLAGLMTMQVMMLAIGLYFSLFGDIDPETKDYFHWVSLVLTVPVVVYSGAGFYANALKALSVKSVNMDVPISIAVWGAFLSSAWATIQHTGAVYFESVCMFIFLLLISRYLEHRSRHRAAEISANTMKHIPVTATLIENGQQTHCLAKKLEPGQQVLVKAGETIPVDGIILSGRSNIDEAMLTGEFEPVSKKAGDTVYGGSINQSNTLTIQVEKTLKQALVSQILRLQEMALASKPRISLLADKLSRFFVVAVLLISAASYSYWYFQAPEQAFWITIAVLVATCPCALGLATPMALTCSLAWLNRQGILLKQSDLLEKLLGVSHIAFDKTGTLTEGKFSITRVINMSQHSDNEIRLLAASLEAYSEHPIAKAFCISQPLLVVSENSIDAGYGLQGEIAGKQYRIGSARYMRNPVPGNIQAASVFLEDERQVLAAFELDDSIRKDAPVILNQLKAKQLLIVSGDNQQKVQRVGETLGIHQSLGQNTPQGKMDIIHDIQKNGGHVLMVGDGINDSPVMAAADVSVAVGGASDLAKKAADIVLLNHKLSALPQLFAMAEKNQKIIKQNLAWALGYNLLVLPLAVSGILTPWMAVIGMSLSSIIVVTNSLRLLK